MCSGGGVSPPSARGTHTRPLFTSDVQSNDLGRWNLQLLVDTSLQVLIEERLELFVLLIEETGLFNQVLSVDKQLVVLAQCLVKGFPHAQLLVR